MSRSKKSRTTAFSLGITGGIGSGKSTVARLFGDLGAGVIDLDTLAHELTASGGQAMTPIAEAFGAEFVSPDGSLDRARMRGLVFQDAKAREKLESILHPMIKEASQQQADKLTGDYVIFVIPLLAEQPVWQGMADRILVVDCPETLQIERVMLRNNMTQEQVEAIMKAQAPRSARRAIADDIILNDKGVEHLQDEVARLHAAYKKIAGKVIA